LPKKKKSKTSIERRDFLLRGKGQKKRKPSREEGGKTQANFSCWARRIGEKTRGKKKRK